MPPCSSRMTIYKERITGGTLHREMAVYKKIAPSLASIEASGVYRDGTTFPAPALLLGPL